MLLARAIYKKYFLLYYQNVKVTQAFGLFFLFLYTYCKKHNIVGISLEDLKVAGEKGDWSVIKRCFQEYSRFLRYEYECQYKNKDTPVGEKVRLEPVTIKDYLYKFYTAVKFCHSV